MERKNRALRPMDWINIGLIVTTVIGFEAYVGDIHGRLDGLKDQVHKLDPVKIREAEESAAARLRGLATSPTLVDQTYEWEKGHDPVQMVKVSDGFCYLTKLTGNLNGRDEAVWITIIGDYWHLGGMSKREFAAGRARC